MTQAASPCGWVLRTCAVLLHAALALPRLAQAGEIAVVSRPGGLASRVAEADLRKLYAGRLAASAEARQVVLVDYAVDVPLRDFFYRSVVGREGSQMHAFWMQQVFSGAGSAPRWVGSVHEMTALVLSDARAVGYVPVADSGALSVLFRISYAD